MKHAALNFKWLVLSLFAAGIITVGLFNGRQYNIYPDGPKTYTHTVPNKL